MVSMQMSAEEAKEYATGEIKPGDAPKYPYGLCLYLDDDTLAKLGLTEPPAVGSELVLSAKVVVTSMGISQQQDGDKEQRCELQITDMALEAGARKSAATVLYDAE